MNHELSLGKYEFHPNEVGLRSKSRRDRIEWLMEQLLHELRELRRDRDLVPEYTDEELAEGYKAMADEEAANPNCYDWED